MKFIVTSWDAGTWKHRPHQREAVIEAVDRNAAMEWASQNAGFGRGYEVVPEPEAESEAIPVKPSRRSRSRSR